MGTRVAVELWSEDADLATRAMDAVIAEMRRTDELMSTYKPESQLSAVNAHAFERPVEVDPEIIDVVFRALDFSGSAAALSTSPTPASAISTTTAPHQRPSASRSPTALPGMSTTGRCRWIRERNTIRSCARACIDLGGIGKGLAVDSGVDDAARLGIEHAMVNSGGDRGC